MRRTNKKWLLGALFLLAALTVMPVSASAKVKLNKTRFSLAVGKSYRLKLKGLTGEEETIVWKSRKPAVAKVNQSGKVVARKTGKAYVYAIVDGTKYRCLVTVRQPVTSISLNRSQKTLQVGKSCKLKAVVGPEDASNKSVTWTSSDKKVAKVSSGGKVTAVGAGTAEIRATAKDGSGVRAVCRITVELGPVELDQTQLSLEAGKSVKLNVTQDGSRYVWATSSKEIASVSSGTVTGVKAGKAVIVVRRVADGKSATCYVTVTAPGKQTQTSAGGKEKEPSAKAKEFLALLEKYSNQVKEDKENGITWSYVTRSGVYVPIYKTWEQNYKNSRKTKNGYASCVQIAQWGLRDLGIIGNGNFRGDIGGGFTIKDKEQLLKHCVILEVNKTPNQLLAEGNLLPGDICSHVAIQHTNVYAGNGLWYDSGRGGDGYFIENTDFIFNSFGPVKTGYSMDSEVIGSIVRIIK